MTKHKDADPAPISLEELARRMLAMPPKTHEQMVKKKPRKRPAKKRP